jgi:hypothetical protein
MKADTYACAHAEYVAGMVCYSCICVSRQRLVGRKGCLVLGAVLDSSGVFLRVCRISRSGTFNFTCCLFVIREACYRTRGLELTE